MCLVGVSCPNSQPVVCGICREVFCSTTAIGDGEAHSATLVLMSCSAGARANWRWEVPCLLHAVSGCIDATVVGRKEGRRDHMLFSRLGLTRL